MRQFLSLVLSAVLVNLSPVDAAPPHGLTNHNVTRIGALTSGGGVPTYLVNQGFEGAGYDNGETWTESGSPDEDYTAIPLLGSQSLRLPISGPSSTYSPVFSQTTAYSYFRFHTPTLTGSGSPLDFAQLHTGTVVAASFEMAAGGAVTIESNGSSSSASATTLSANTTYHVWLTFVSGGTCELAISTTGTKPTVDGSGNVYLTKTGASVTAIVILLASPGDDLIFDRVLVDDAVIGDNP